MRVRRGFGGRGPSLGLATQALDVVILQVEVAPLTVARYLLPNLGLRVCPSKKDDIHLFCYVVLPWPVKSSSLSFSSAVNIS